VHNLLVHGGANRKWKTVVALERRQGSAVANHLLSGKIDLERCDARLHHLAKFDQHLPNEPSGGPHLVQLFSRLPNNHFSKL